MQNIEVVAKDGATISAVAVGLEDNNIKGIIIISHGFGEHSGSYVELAEVFQKAGYASIIPDQRGHGKQREGVKNRHGVIPHYQCFTDDIIKLTEYAEKTAPQTPIALYGHSMGGNIIINTLLRASPERVSSYFCAVLESPWLDLYDPPSLFVVGMAKVLNRIMPNLRNKRKMRHEVLSSNEERAGGYSRDPLYHGYISMRMFSGILAACEYAMDNAAGLSVPTYLAYADNELVVCNKAILRFAEMAGGMITIKEYVSNHAIHNDEIRETFCSDVITFIDSNLPTGS